MRHAILGPGGVGGLIGAVLGKAGANITLVVRPGSAQEYPRELSLESPLGNVRIPVQVVSELTDSYDVLWVTVKATQLDAALKNVRDASGIGNVVPLLNGIDHVRKLRERFGHDRVIPATIAVETERVAPGMIVHRSPFLRLNVAATGKDHLKNEIEVFSRFGFECKFVDDETTLLWGKLVFLAPLALAGTANDAPLGDINANSAEQEKLFACVREACAVANAYGAKVSPDPLIEMIKKTAPATRSSMQKDVAAGRPPELDAIAGPILRGAAEFEIPVPATMQFVERVRERIQPRS